MECVVMSYRSDITIVPPTWLSNLLNVFSNPSPARIAEFIQTGEQATWPKLERIRNATRISRAFEHCLERLRVRFALPTAADQAPRHDVA
jgi:TAG lipase/steryl ester hydrolase/phospholipase A2/LPA acyltransferase